MKPHSNGRGIIDEPDFGGILKAKKRFKSQLGTNLLTTLKFQIEHTARKKLTRLKKSTNHLARDTKIGPDIEAIDI